MAKIIKSRVTTSEMKYLTVIEGDKTRKDNIEIQLLKN